MSAKNRLNKLLSPLCSTDEDFEILKALCDDVVEMDDESITFSELDVAYEKDESITAHQMLPASFGKIANLFTRFVWDGGGPEVGFELGEDQKSLADDELYFEAFGESEEEPMAAFLGGQQAFFFSNERKLNNGEPSLIFISHDEVEPIDVEGIEGLDYQQIFLRLLSDAALETEYFEEIYF